MSIIVREARPGDERVIVELIGELARTGGEASPITEGYAREYLAFAPSGSNVLLAEQESHAVGLLSYSIRPNLYHAANSALIEELVVRESARGQGVGNALLSELLNRLPSLGCAEVSVSTMPDNQDAIRFYRSHGLVDEAVFLEKHLTEPSSLAEPLSERELAVLRLVAAGLSNREIAAQLIVSPGTAKSHVNHICGKLGVRNRTEAVARAKELGLI